MIFKPNYLKASPATAQVYNLEPAPAEFGLGEGYYPDDVCVYFNGLRYHDNGDYTYNAHTGELIMSQRQSYITLEMEDGVKPGDSLIVDAWFA